MIKAADLEKIVEDMKNPRPFIRGKAVDSFMMVRDEEAIPFLYKIVQKEMDFIKVQYCRLMAKLRNRQAVGPLVALLLGQSEKVAAEAALALDQIDDDAKIEALMSLLKHENEFARSYAIKTLGLEKRIKAVPLLMDALATGVAESRIMVIDSLRQIGDPAAIYPLTKLLQEGDEGIVYEALYALGEIGDKITGAKIMPFLDHREADIRRAAVWAVGKLEYGHAVAKLIGMLKSDPDDEVREEICRRLGRFGGKRVLEPLAVARTSDRAHNVKVYADWALKEIQKDTTDEAIAREIDEKLNGPRSRKGREASR